MKSLYNISGILPAQSRTNPNDCGIAWSEHRKAEKVKREEEIHIESAPVPAHIKEFIDKIIDENTRLTMDLISLRGKQGKAKQEILKPIDPQTIQVGDTVRLVGMRKRYEWASLKVGENYTIAQVDNSDDYMSVRILSPCGRVWIYDEDLMLVESA